MARPFLISVSGMVGSGKSTVLRHLRAALEAEGIGSEEWQFQRLPCVTLRPAFLARKAAGAGGASKTAEVRGRGYRRKRLTAALTMAYLARMTAFAWFRRRQRREPCALANRYFYDNFVHYDFDTRASRFFAAVLTRAMPRPDVAILLLPSATTAAGRRPNYTAEYILAVEDAYRHLCGRFPELVAVSSEPGDPTFSRVEEIVRERIVGLKKSRG